MYTCINSVFHNNKKTFTKYHKKINQIKRKWSVQMYVHSTVLTVYQHCVNSGNVMFKKKCCTQNISKHHLQCNCYVSKNAVHNI